MSRLLLLADLHLGGAPSRGEADVELAYARAERLRTAVAAEFVGGPGRAPVAATLLAGDLFDRADPSDRALDAAERLLDTLSSGGAPIVGIAGNHDAESPLPARLRPRPGVRWLSARYAESVELPGLGIVVHGRSIGDPEESRDLVAEYPPPVSGTVNLGLLHTSLDGGWSRRDCAPTTLAALGAHGYDGWLLGHVHERRVLGSEPLIAFIGSDAAHRDGDTGPFGYATLDVAPGALALHHHDLP